jgi:hypothetical protein
VTFAEQRQIIRSRNGLYLVPRLDFNQVHNPDRIIAPGSQSTIRDAGALETWAQTKQALPVEYFHPAGATQRFAFDATLIDLAKWSSKTDAQSSSITLEYPAERLPLVGKSWPFYRMLTAIFLGFLGVGIVFIVEQWWGTRRKAVSLQPVMA